MPDINWTKSFMEAISERFLSAHIIDLKENSVTVIKSTNNVEQLRAKYTDGQEQINAIMGEIAVGENKRKLMKFINLSTLPERMEEHNIEECVFYSKRVGWCKANFIRVNDEKPLNRVMIVVEDINKDVLREQELIEKNKKAAETANLDSLTNLPNRNAFEEEVTIYQEGHLDKSGVFCLADVDDFKVINNILGHPTGDEALRKVAACLLEHCPSDSVISRVGGDEFAIYFKHATIQEAKEVLESIFTNPPSIKYRNTEHRINLSMGLAQYPTDGKNLSVLERKAEIALHFVKSIQKNGYQVYYKGLEQGNHFQLGFNLHDIIASIPGAVVVCRADKEGTILFVNEDVARLFDCESLNDFYDYSQKRLDKLVEKRYLSEANGAFSYHLFVNDSSNSAAMEESYVEIPVVTKKKQNKVIEGVGHRISSPLYGNIFYLFMRESFKSLNPISKKRIKYRGKSSTMRDWNGREAYLLEALAKEYGTVFEVDLENNALTVYRMPVKLSENEMRLFEEGDYEKIMTTYANTMVSEDDKKHMKRLLSLDYLKERLSNEHSFTTLYRNRQNNYYEMRVIRDDDESGTPSYALMAFTNRDEETREHKESIKEREFNLAVIESFASEFRSTYFANLVTEEVTVIRKTDMEKEDFDLYFDGTMDYTRFYDWMCEHMVIPSDREKFKRDLSIRNIKKKLAGKKTFKAIFQCPHKDYVHFSIMQVTKLEDEDSKPTKVVIAFMERDEEIGMQYMASQVMKEYTTIAYCNLMEDTMRYYKLKDRRRNMVDEVRFSDDIYEFAQGLDSEYREIWERIAEPLTLQEMLRDTEHLEVIAKKNGNNPWGKCDFRVALRDSNGVAELVIMTFMPLSDSEVEKQELNTRIAQQNLMLFEKNKRISRILGVIAGLTREYHTVWLVNKKDYTMRLIRTEGDFILTDTISQAREMNDYSVSSMLYVDMYVDESDRERMRKAVHINEVKRQLANKDRYEVNFLRVSKDGEKRYQQIVYVNADSDEGERSFLFAYRDIDDMIRMEVQKREELEKAKEAAEVANAAKSSFLFNMSHDIRTPLNAIIGFTELAEEDEYDFEKQRDYRQKIKMASHQLLDILNNVLEMARIENKKLVIDEELTDGEEFFKTWTTVFESDIRKKNLVLDAKIDVQHSMLFLDRTHLAEVLMNLMSNAIKYTPEGGTITVRSQELPGDGPNTCRIRSTIKDNGIGMSESFLNTIFDEFSRERNGSESAIKGTGLGMAIVKRLVDMMNGTIEITSKVGKGTTVVVNLPHRYATSKEVFRQPKRYFGKADLKGKRILLAEDTDVNAILARELLSRNGLLVDRAKDGVQCIDMLSKAESGYYDLILMDVQMPNLNGYEASRRIREMEDKQKASIPILAMTANAFKEDKMLAEEAGMNGHISKPLDVTKMFELIAQVTCTDKG